MPFSSAHSTFLTLLAILLGFSSCDWLHYSFMNSIPAHSDPKNNSDIYVYLGLDGLSYDTVKAAMKKGAFANSSWNLSKFIAMFPATSDASWTRIMHAEKMKGYEIEYYDPEKDRLMNKGFLGLAKHVLPNFAESFNFEENYFRSFDYRANGYLHPLEAYGDTFVALSNSLDNLFLLLSNRSLNTQVFSAYLIEYDILGHMQSAADTTEALVGLANRIEQFKRHHKSRNFHFTLVSDHGMDFTPITNDKMVEFNEELGKVGIRSVESLKNHDPKTEIYALPVTHTRVTYLALHTHPDLTEEVALRTSRLPSVDLSIGKLTTRPWIKGEDLQPFTEWYGIWSEGNLALFFGFDPVKNCYYLPKDFTDFKDFDFKSFDFKDKNPTNYPRYDISLPSDTRIFSDKTLFDLTKNGRYPDLFYRTRTGLSKVGVKFPAEVLVSFRPSYVSMGFALGGKDIGTSGSHGSMERQGTLGTLLSDERTLPDAVRSDNFLDLFPRLKQHLLELGQEPVEGDPNASIAYD